MKMTAPTIGKIVGAAVAVVAGALVTGRATSRAPEPLPAQSTLSAPAATSADIAALRQHVDGRFDEFNGRLSAIEGYMKAQQEAALQKALAGGGKRP
jgi:hypothetical protein